MLSYCKEFDTKGHIIKYIADTLDEGLCDVIAKQRVRLDCQGEEGLFEYWYYLKSHCMNVANDDKRDGSGDSC
ncbi:hypothetical protein CXF80_03100 [Shewanella sp. Actino-trap-3]|jgi:hypothetical protein|nr:hypothetical protein CXF80_03100 [Shewanella sp. Actino-trap-3]